MVFGTQQNFNDFIKGLQANQRSFDTARMNLLLKQDLMTIHGNKLNLIFDFNDFTSYPTKNDFKLIVTDNVGNSTKFESTFYRKK